MLNTGIIGANVVREIELVRHKNLMDYNPDLVILGYNIHNLEQGYHHVDRTAIAERDRESFESDTSDPGDIIFTGPDYGIIPYDLILKIKGKSVLLQTFIYSNELLLQKLKLRDWSRLYIEGNPNWKRTKTAFYELAAICADAGVPGLVVMFPVLSNLGAHYPFSAVHGVVEEEISKIGLHFLDLLPAFKGKNARSLWVHPLDRHPNAEGHQIAAQVQASYLIHQDWFTPNK